MLAVEETNLAESLDDKELKEIARKVIEDTENDLDSRSDWEEKHAKWLKLYYQTDVPEEAPWDGASEEGFPVFTEAVNQFQSRTYKAFFPRREFIEAIPVGHATEEATDRAERIAEHMNLQLGELDKTYKPNKNQMFMAVALHGSDFTKTYFSHIKKRTVIERVRATDLIVPYHVGPIAIEDLERKTHYKIMSLNDTKILKKMGYFNNDCKVYEGEYSSKTQEAIEESSGITGYNYNKDKAYDCHILEQHCLLDLDEDGIAEPYIVWVDRQSQNVLRIQIRYEVDKYGAPLFDKQPIEHFTHYQFMPNPDGFYGFGLGQLMGKLNTAINKLVRQFVDAGLLANQGNNTFFISENLGIDGDEYEVRLGRGNKIPRNVEDIRKGIMQLQFAGPNQQLATMIEFLNNSAQRLSSSSDILAGQPDKVYQPMALMTMLDQGLQLYSSVQEFIGHSMESELQKVYRLNAKYLQDEIYYTPNDPQIQVTQDDYVDDFRIKPIFDPKNGTKSQKLARAQAGYQFALSDPIAQQNPEVIWKAGVEYLEALGFDNVEDMYPPPQVPEVVRIDDQNLENAYFIMPADKRPLFDVFPDQEHMEHMRIIDKFIAYLDGAQALTVPTVEGGDPSISRLVATMSEEQKKEIIANLLRHRSQHLAFLYAQSNGAMDEQGNQTTESGQPGLLEGAAGNEADLAQVMQLLQAV